MTRSRVASLAALSALLVSLVTVTAARAAELDGTTFAPEYVFPEGAGVIDVKRDFGAKGDGRTDDTEAIWPPSSTP